MSGRLNVLNRVVRQFYLDDCSGYCLRLSKWHAFCINSLARSGRKPGPSNDGNKEVPRMVRMNFARSAAFAAIQTTLRSAAGRLCVKGSGTG
jgi:hypothetical protein